jgi:hypothetical protein
VWRLNGSKGRVISCSQQVFTYVRVYSATAGEWQRDLTVESVEPNPGPCTGAVGMGVCPCTLTKQDPLRSMREVSVPRAITVSDFIPQPSFLLPL